MSANGQTIEILGAILFVFTVQTSQARPLNTFIANESSTHRLLAFTLFQSDVAPSEDGNEIAAMHKTWILLRKKNPPSTFRKETFFFPGI